MLRNERNPAGLCWHASPCLQVKLMRQVRVEAMHRRAGAGGETLIGATPNEKGSNLKILTGRPP